MIRNKLLLVLIFAVAFVLAPAASWALPYIVNADISSIAGLEFYLSFQLYDNNWNVGDSFLYIDNVFISDVSGVISPPGVIDFESGGFEGFIPDPIDPDAVNVVPGGFTGGMYLLEIQESWLVFPTITYRGFAPSGAQTLQFDFELATTSTTDSMVAAITQTGEPFFDPFPWFPGLYGMGDFMEVGSDYSYLADGVTMEPIPEPSTLLLMLGGLVGIVGYRKARGHKR